MTELDIRADGRGGVLARAGQTGQTGQTGQPPG